MSPLHLKNVNGKLNILHVMSAKSPVTINFAKFLLKNFGSNHYFLPIGKNGQKEFSNTVENTISIDLIFDKRKPIKTMFNVLRFPVVINKYDVIIFHSLFIHWVIIIYLFLFYRDIVKKSIWMEWGGDLYEVKFKFKIVEKFYWEFVRALKAIITIFDGDVDAVRNIAKFDGIIYEGCYGPPSLGGFDKLPIICKTKHVRGETVVVQVGHSTNSSNNHIKILDMLAKYRNQNIKVFLPINYGNMKYSKRVAEYAKEIFNKDKLIILQEYVPLDEYLKLLDKVDVCIFDTFRQLGLGNLYYFLGHNIPIYLNKNGVMYKYWSKMGMNIGDVDNINNIGNVEDLIFENNNQENSIIIQKYDDKYFYELWKGIFTKIENDFRNE